jgi:hypothetical protein
MKDSNPYGHKQSPNIVCSLQISPENKLLRSISYVSSVLSRSSVLLFFSWVTETGRQLHLDVS